MNLSNNELIRIEKLENQIKLKDLNLSNNKITKLENLDALKELIELTIWNNVIQNIEGLKNLTNLEILHLNQNLIQKITGLETLSLKTLILSALYLLRTGDWALAGHTIALLDTSGDLFYNSDHGKSIGLYIFYVLCSMPAIVWSSLSHSGRLLLQPHPH